MEFAILSNKNTLYLIKINVSTVFITFYRGKVCTQK